MIIHAIKAENVLKYTSLNINEIPECGVIAISGPNESGKSSIGETVCFALFGRTFSLDVGELSKIILWGETHCSAQLEFSCGDGQRYRLERYLDNAGNHSACLAAMGSVEVDDSVVRGVDKVADRVFQLIGFEFDEFVESFYLAQREITTPHPHSYAVKTMAGLVTLEYCGTACQEDRDATIEELKQRNSEVAEMQTRIDELGIDPGLLAGLESEHREITQRMEASQRLIDDLDSASMAYQDAIPKREQAYSKRGRAGFLGFFCLLLALLTGGAWYLLVKLPEHAWSISLSAQVANLIPDRQTEVVPWLLVGAGVFAVLSLILWTRRILLKKLALSYAETALTLSNSLNSLASLSQNLKEHKEHEQLQTEVSENPVEESAIAEEQTPQAIDYIAHDKLKEHIIDWHATYAEVRDGVAHELTLLNMGVEGEKRRLGQLDQAISQEQERIDKALQLQEVLADLKEKIESRQRHIEICQVADELIQGTTREVSHQFNRKLRGLVSKTLPLFTENRYEHLQIDDDLSVRAFSNEKRDFMDLEEISSGTQRQIMLAVRLALSQELAGRTVRGEQFLFLDEPFAFFDEMRTRCALTVLPTLSDELNQIWIVAQDFADDLHFDYHVKCDRSFQSIPAS
ncbi:MAG: AAA family ATPase [Candidatus Thiodiazotropha sp.]